MKNRTLLTLAAAITVFLAAPAARAATLTWDANAATTLRTDGAGVWDTTASNVWWDGSANVTWASGSDAVFGNGGAGGAVTLAGPTTVNSLRFDYFTGTYTLGGAGQTITNNNGITKNAGAGIVTLVSTSTLGGAQAWVNNSAANINVQAATTLNGVLTIGGSGVTSFDNANAVIGGSGGIIKNGTGHLNLSGGASPAHTFTGDIVVNGGSIGFQAASVLIGRNVKLTDGYLGGRFGSGFTWTNGLGTGANQIQITGGVSGFSGEGGTVSTFQIGAAGSTLTWGDASFNPSVLLLNGDVRMNANGKGSLNNAIDLNGATRTITSLHVTDGAANSGFTVSRAISNNTGTAGLTKTGPGNLILSAANTYNGPTTINGGSITLSGSGTINSSSALNLGGGTLRMVNTAQVDRFADGAGITNIGGGAISYENTSGGNTYTETLGSATLSGGQLNIVESVNQAGAGAQTLTLGGLTQSGSAAVTFSALTTGPQASGNKNMIVVTGAGTTTAGEIIGPWATVGTAAANQTDYAVYNANYVTPANLGGSLESTWSTTHAVGSNYTMANAAGAATTLTATRNINSLRNTSSAQNVTVDIVSDTVTNIGHAFQNGDVFTFGGTAPGGTANGNVYYVRDVGVDTFKVAASSAGAAIDLTSAGTPNVTGGIALSSGNNLGTYGILSAAGSGLAIGGSGTGAVTLPTTNAGSLYVTPGNGAVITIAIPIADNTASGVLTLVKNGSATLRLEGHHTYAGNTIINAGTLQVGNNSTATMGSGNYAGNIFIASGAALTLQGNSANTLSGIISGGGNLNANRGTTTLSGANTYSGKTSLTAVAPNSNGSTLSVSSFNSVNGGTPLLASSSLGCPTTVANGTIDFGGGGIQVGMQVTYTGPGETTDRVINFQFNGTGTRTLDASGSGLLKFTSTPTANATATSHVTLQGNGDGEFVGGLPFAFVNFNKSGAGTWTLGGAVGNTGVLTINAGTLALQKRSSLMGGGDTNWTAAKINVKSGAMLALNVDSAGAAGFDNANLDTLLTAISVAGSAAAGLQSGARLGFDTSTATGGIFTQGNAIANSTGANGGAIAVTKLGTGTLVLDKTNTYTGATKVTGGFLAVSGSGALGNTAITVKTNGTLQLDGTTGGGLITVEAGGKLRGVGTAGGSVVVSGILAPGNSIGTLSVGALSLQNGSEFAAEIDAAIPDADLVNANGNLVIAGTVTLSLGSHGADQVIAPDTILTLISYSGTWDNGTFSGRADDSTFVHGVNTYKINYNDTLGGGAHGNDVTLTVVPEPTTVGLIGLIGFAGYFRRRRNIIAD